jgi:DNA-binding winged helix-turn-helix (wHTH) protein
MNESDSFGEMNSSAQTPMASSDIKLDERTTPLGYSYLFGRFQLKVANSHLTLWSDGRAIALSIAESTILRVLLDKPGEFVKTDDLLNSVTRSSKASENIVHGAVRGLRRTLNDADLIKTERSKGYCFTGEVERRTGDESPDVFLSEPNSALINSVQPAATNQSRSREPTAERRRDSFAVVAALVSAPVVLLPFGLLFFGGNLESLPNQLGFIQALMILVALGYDFYFSEQRESRSADPETRRASVAVQQLRRCWRLLLATWCCLYLTLPFSQWFAPTSPGLTPSLRWEALQVIATFLNNSSALMLVLCYVVLNRPTVIRVADRDVETVPLQSGLFLVAGIGLLEGILVAVSGHFGLPAYADDVLFGADLLSGVVGGIAMALCISRLDSRLLGTTRLLPIVPIVLYLYVVIQPFYPLVNRTLPNRQGLHQHFDLWIIQLAFMLKSILYIYVTQLFKSERFLFYMIHARRVYENVEAEWSGFKSAGKSA